MRLAIAILLAVMTGMLAQAQSRDGSTGPFTGYEAETLSEVWPKIREAAHFEDINWQALGLQRAPGSPDAQRLLAYSRRIGTSCAANRTSGISTGVTTPRTRAAPSAMAEPTPVFPTMGAATTTARSRATNSRR